MGSILISKHIMYNQHSLIARPYIQPTHRLIEDLHRIISVISFLNSTLMDINFVRFMNNSFYEICGDVYYSLDYEAEPQM